jgi:hypothetical protein
MSHNLQSQCSLHLTRNASADAARARLQLGSDHSGAVVKKLSPLSHAAEVLQENDVVTHIAGKAIADDCTLAFRDDERISMQHAIRDRHIGDEVDMRILRRGVEHAVRYRLGHCLYKVPGLHGVDCLPSYYIYGAPRVRTCLLCSLPAWRYAKLRVRHNVPRCRLCGPMVRC